MNMATVYIFMQYISGGSLQSILKRYVGPCDCHVTLTTPTHRFGPLDSHTVSHYTRQITNSLVYLHDNGIIHRDIKGANIMVNSRGVVKLIDFGCAKNCQVSQRERWSRYTTRSHICSPVRIWPATCTLFVGLRTGWRPRSSVGMATGGSLIYGVWGVLSWKWPPPSHHGER